MMTHTTAAPALLAALAALAAAPAGQAQDLGCLWERHESLPLPRFEAGTFPIDGLLYCFGGFYTNAIEATSQVDAYDPVTDTWTRKADLPSPTTHIAFARDGRDIWMIGGFLGDHPGIATTEVWVHDVDQDSYTAGPPLPRPLAGGAAALIGRQLHFYGGCEIDRDTVTGDHWVLDLDDQAAGWSPRTPMPVPRCHHSGLTLGGEVWAIGGAIGHDLTPLDVRSVHIYDPATDTWREGPLLPEPRSHFEPGTFVRDGKIYIAGGKDLSQGLQVVGGMLELDPALGEWSYLPFLPFPRYGIGAQPIGDRLYLAGGATWVSTPTSDVLSRPWDADYPNPLRINCGGSEIVAASGSCCWCSDVGFENGRVTAFTPGVDIQGTDDDALFHRQRNTAPGSGAPVRYRLPMGNGHFRVRFHLAERVSATPGSRLVSLVVEGEELATALDLAVDPGFEAALERGFDVRVDDGVLQIEVQALGGQEAYVGALEIERLGPEHFALECSNPPNSTGSPATMGFVGTTSVGDSDLVLTAGPVPTSQFGLLVQALAAGSYDPPGGGGTLCLSQPLHRFPPAQAQGNLLSVGLDLQDPPPNLAPIVGGSTWRFQAWYRDPGMAAGFGFSNALKLVFTP